MRELEQFVIQRDIALIVCGDLNSEPDSAVYEYMMEGVISMSRPELDITDNIRVLPDLSNIVHNIELVSAMGVSLGEEPPFTNFTGKFRGTLDYICFTPSRLRVMAVTGFPDASELEAENGVGLPSASYASDHLMLCCDLAFAISGTGSITRVPSASSRKPSTIPMATSPTKSLKGLSGRSPAGPGR
jgi:CCR4-NOT transcription complex subunit 6